MKVVDPPSPSPFAASLLFGYVANFLYDGDAPLAERRAQALSVDQTQLRELIGDAELRDLLDAGRNRRRRAAVPASGRDSSRAHRPTRCTICCSRSATCRSTRLTRARTPAGAATGGTARGARRICAVPIAGEARYIAVEDAARYRDALGVPLPPGIPEALLLPVADPVAISCPASRAHTAHSRRPTSRGVRHAGTEPCVRPSPHSSARGRCSKASFAPGASIASSLTRTSCVNSAADRSRGFAGRSRRLSLPRSDGSPWRGRRSVGRRRGRMRCSTSSSNCRAPHCPRRFSKRTSWARASRATRRSGSIHWPRPVKSAGSACSRWASATAGSRCTSPIRCRRSSPAPPRRHAGRREPRDPRLARETWRVVFRRAARGGGRRFPGRDRRGVVASRLAWSCHERHILRAARLHRTVRETPEAPLDRAGAFDRVALSRARPKADGRSFERAAASHTRSA